MPHLPYFCLLFQSAIIRSIFLNQVILGYDHDSSAVSTICAKHDLINTYMISMISYTFALELYIIPENNSII